VTAAQSFLSEGVLLIDSLSRRNHIGIAIALFRNC